MKFLPILLFIILLVRDLRKFAISYTETNIINYKDILGIIIMLAGIGLISYNIL